MTKKDYQLVADAIMEAMGGDDKFELRYSLVSSLSHRFKMANERFDPAKFRAATKAVWVNAPAGVHHDSKRE